MRLTHEQIIEDIEERISHESAPDSTADILPALGANLRRLRVRRGHSLERLSALSGVSRAMLNEVELGHSAPTINVVWRIANALDVPFSALLKQTQTPTAEVLRAESTPLLTSNDGRFISRALFPVDAPRRTELYELRVRAGASEHAEAHAPGTTENIVVVQGHVRIVVGNREPLDLYAGDAALFEADEPHVYSNVTNDDALAYLVMSYALVLS